MKIIAYYLPQFHEIEENNQWWGQGFTEWINIKKAVSYRNSHIPAAPEKDYFYNLMDRETVEWQTKLASDYGIHGFCYYHYWFSGKKILERPAENLFNWTDIKQNFCFCWANHSWKKTWNGTMEMLIEQSYGREEEWQDHFDYLKPFFLDDRYIKINNKPVFVLYDAQSIPDFESRVSFMNKCCQGVGLDGIYVIESHNQKKQTRFSSASNGVVVREPNTSMSDLGLFLRIRSKLKRMINQKYLKAPIFFPFKQIANKSISYLEDFQVKGKTLYPGLFTGWDSSPRHRKHAIVLYKKGFSEFQDYLEQFKKSYDCGNYGELVFMNAWNEWAEGMYLEPDKENGYAYLVQLKEMVSGENS